MVVATKKQKAKPKLTPEEIKAVCAELRALHRRRTRCISARIRISNERLAYVALTLGYSAGLEEEERERLYEEARKVVKLVLEQGDPHQCSGIIVAMEHSVEGLSVEEAAYEKAMKKLVSQLPAADWAVHPKRKGFGLQSLATIIGECGDLTDYENPAKVWRRMGLAPWTYNGKTLMGATWKSGRYGTLPAEQWELFGYSPRRRSIAYIIGENIVKQNDDGPYRRMYDQEKERKIADREFSKHLGCNGAGVVNGKKCKGCDGAGVTKRRAHLHGMIRATKALLLDLWLDWHGIPWQEWRDRGA